MPPVRTGARSFNDIIRKACRLSHIPGWAGGMEEILGEVGFADIAPLWYAFCAAFETLMSLDDHFNREDRSEPNPTGGEDEGRGV